MSANLKDDIPSSAAVPESGTNGDCLASSGAISLQDPVFKKLAVINGMVNKLTKDQMKEKLAQLHLDTRGQKDVLKKRLKSYYKRKTLSRAQGVPKKRPRYDYFLVIDFEATCDTISHNYPHEIIEFPAVLVNASDGSKVDEFHSYVKPTKNSHLSEFCRNLTNITQEQVDSAPSFTEVLCQMEEWMTKHRLGHGKKFAIVTDGPWDMSRFMFMQCLSSGIPLPAWAQRWINIRKIFCNAYRVQKANILSMLETLGLAFEGNQHSGIDDSRNISRILEHLITDGCNVYVNETMYHDKIAATSLTPVDVAPEIVVVQQNEDVPSSDECESDELENRVPSIENDLSEASRPITTKQGTEKAADQLAGEKCANLFENLSLQCS